jgi:hypothetical protein
MVAVAVTTATNNVKCMMQLVQLVAFKPKFLSVQVATVLFIAETVSAKTTTDVNLTPKSHCQLTVAFL